MSGASILIIYYIWLAFVSLYFQGQATDLFEGLLLAACSSLRSLFPLCSVVTVKILNAPSALWEVAPSVLQIMLMARLWSDSSICVGDSCIEDMFLWAPIFEDQAERIIAGGPARGPSVLDGRACNETPLQNGVRFGSRLPSSLSSLLFRTATRCLMERF